MSAFGENHPAVVVTGSSTGIGAACVRELDRRGFRVFAGVRAMADGDRLRAAASPRLIPLQLDVTRPESIAAAAQAVREAVGAAGLGGLVNNAGIAVAGPLEIRPPGQTPRSVRGQRVGRYGVTQAMLPLLRQGRGRIVNISSMNGRIAPPYLGAYAASKHALEALSDALRIELRSWGIQVAVVQPGRTATAALGQVLRGSDRLVSTRTKRPLPCTRPTWMPSAPLAAQAARPKHGPHGAGHRPRPDRSPAAAPDIASGCVSTCSSGPQVGARQPLGSHHSASLETAELNE